MISVMLDWATGRDVLESIGQAEHQRSAGPRDWDHIGSVVAGAEAAGTNAASAVADALGVNRSTAKSIVREWRATTGQPPAVRSAARGSGCTIDLAEVARVATAAWDSGLSVSHTLAEHFGITPNAASSRVYLARQAGHTIPSLRLRPADRPPAQQVRSPRSVLPRGDSARRGVLPADVAVSVEHAIALIESRAVRS